jgi:hypothetical protein
MNQRIGTVGIPMEPTPDSPAGDAEKVRTLPILIDALAENLHRAPYQMFVPQDHLEATT